MTRLFRKVRVVGIACLVVGNLVFASEQTRLSSLDRSGAGVLFFPYPATVSMAGVAPVRRVHSHFRIDQSVDALNFASSTNGVSLYGPDFGRSASRYLPASSADAVRGQNPSRDDVASDDDEWHFQANPQLGVNHEHEKGLTFSVRRGF